MDLTEELIKNLEKLDDEGVWSLYSYAIKELKKRNLVRTRNIVGELAGLISLRLRGLPRSLCLRGSTGAMRPTSTPVSRRSKNSSPALVPSSARPQISTICCRQAKPGLSRTLTRGWSRSQKPVFRPDSCTRQMAPPA